MQALRNQWYCAALSAEITSAPLARIFLHEPVVMYRTSDGRAVALEDRCCHRRAPLSRGQVEGDNLRCGYHGLLYEPSGRVIWAPGQDKLPAGAQVRSYPFVEKHGWAWIWMGDPALADPKNAPAFHWYDAPGWAGCGACLDVKANYMLLVDNLLDLSHLAFLHIKTIGAADDTNPNLTWERAPNLLRGVRIARNLSPSQRQIAQGDTLRTDSTKIMTFTPPGNVVIEISAVEAGKTENDPTNRVNRKLVVLDSMTPETDTSCHYFWGNCRNYAIDDKAVTEMVLKSTAVAFDEDKFMLEAEQRIIDLSPSAPQIDLVGDAGGLQARRMVERLLAEENALSRAAE
ncbi:MAG TPA: aromatic ring-hydroxylating dioxygenase subunit alpha [Stellaceae bacterium]|jgi:vanillate O-demethylase monooxygenase subunit|nr:aromatic ring-hydroxylating dioxygenase subunit alpha [Stellaceae bacterium]